MDSIVSNLLHFADIQPDATAVIDQGRELSYGELRLSVEATAAWLHQSSVRPGQTVALSLDRSPGSSLRSLQFFYASAYLGAILLPLYPDVPDSRRAALLAHFNARWLISADARTPIANASPIDPTKFEWQANEHPGMLPPRGDHPERPFLYLSTSGSTGTPKLCLLSFAQFAQQRRAASIQRGSTSSDRKVPAVPWPTAVGLRSLFSLHAVGGALANVRFPETRLELAKLVHGLGVTQLSASPFQLRRLLASEMPAGFRLPQLRLLYVAGAFISREEIEACRRTITPNVCAGYATTEMGLIAFLGPQDPLTTTTGVGKLIPEVMGQAVDEGHRPLPPGSVGRLRFRAPWAPQGYAGNEEATARRFRDGWFYPGDIGAIDAAGWVTLRGRTDNIINYGGVKILPEEIEQVFAQHPDVLDAALIGIPDPMAEQLPVAFIVFRPEVSGKNLHGSGRSLYDFCAQQIDGRLLPVRIVAVPEIPRNPEGKILRDRLRDGYLANTPVQPTPNS